MNLPEPGHVFNERYRIERVLGRGGFAEVYLAQDVQLARLVALKVLLPGARGYKGDVARRFEREARVIAGLRSDHTITMFDYGTSADGLLYMVFEYVEGSDLEHLLKERGQLPSEVVAHILMQVLTSLGEAHAAGVLHRDLKPGNILVFPFGADPYSVRLIDFGIAKPFVERTTEATHLTADGMVVGTPRYMAPEQFFGEDLSPATDIYSLGLIAHEMVLGRRAINEDDPKAVILQQIGVESIQLPPGSAAPHLVHAINAMTAREQRNRPQSAEAVMHLLQSPVPPRMHSSASSPSSPSAAPSQPVPAPEQRRTRPRGLLPVMAGALALLGVAGAGVFLVPDESTPAPRVATKRELPSALTKAAPAPSPPREELIVEPDLGPPAPVDGCGAKVAGRSLRAYQAKVDFTRRSWVTYTPDGYDPNRRYPIVMLFHRNSRTAKSFMAATRMASLADEHGFIALSFEGEDNPPWNSPLDVDAVRQALAETAAERCVDTTRLYAIGDGAGGRFARNLACSMPLSAVATTFSGMHPGESICTSNPPTPFARFYGTEDKDIPINGGQGCLGGKSFLSVREIEDLWLETLQCAEKPQTWVNESGQRCKLWKCDAAIVSCGMKGGHEWPTAPPPLFKLPSCASDPADFPLGEVMWKFFSEHGKSLPELH